MQEPTSCLPAVSLSVIMAYCKNGFRLNVRCFFSGVRLLFFFPLTVMYVGRISIEVLLRFVAETQRAGLLKGCTLVRNVLKFKG